MKNENSNNPLNQLAGVSIGASVVMIILGCLAIAAPTMTGLALSVVFGWIIIAAGIAYFGYAFTATGPGGFIWRILVGFAYMAGGIYLVVNPDIALGALTLAISAVFVAEGVFRIIGFFEVKEVPGSGWMIFDGIVSVVIGLFIGAGWPGTSVWVLGTLVGANLLVSGFTRLMVSSLVKSEVTAATH